MILSTKRQRQAVGWQRSRGWVDRARELLTNALGAESTSLTPESLQWELFAEQIDEVSRVRDDPPG